MTTLSIVLISTIGIGGLMWFVARYMMLWLQACVSGANISLLQLILMPMRRVDPRVIVRAKVMAVHAGLATITTNTIEAQYLAGGNVHRVILALISAKRANIILDWNTAAAIDLAGRDILEAVKVTVNPKVIHCPHQESNEPRTLNGVAKDGIQLKVRTLVTVRTNLKQLIGGAIEPTIIARVGQGIVSAIGACESYRQALRDPALISRQVIAKGLDSQTSFSIVSIDIAYIEVGANIGAKLRFDQANADIRIARAQAEKRRAMAIARQQEMVALTREHEAQFVLAEAQIPPTIAAAFRHGQLRFETGRNSFNSQKPGANGLSYRARRTPTLLGRSESATATQVAAWESEGGRCQALQMRRASTDMEVMKTIPTSRYSATGQ